MKGWRRELLTVSEGISVLCHERTRLQREQFMFRNVPRDQRHTEWEKRLEEIEFKKNELVYERKKLLLLGKFFV